MNSITIVFSDANDLNENELCKFLYKRKTITAKKLCSLIPQKDIYITEISIDTHFKSKSISNNNGNISASQHIKDQHSPT